MRVGFWVVAAWAMVACGGNGGGEDNAATDSGSTTTPLDLCEEFPIRKVDLESLNCTGLENAWKQVEIDGKRCEVDDDCRLTNGYCNVNLTGLEQIGINRCVADSLIAEFATEIAPCDDDTRDGCIRATVVGVSCLYGECTEIIED